MTETLGKSVLELEANLTPFRKGVRAAKGDADDLRGALEALAAVANISEKELNRLGLHRTAAVESDTTASLIIKGVRGIGEESRRAARDLDDVKLDSANAAETTAAGDAIDRKLKDITGNANEARRSLESVNLASAGAGGGGRGIGLLGAGIGAGTLLGPAAGPGAIGLLAAIPVLATTGAGALGVLALAFQGVGKAIGGDKKAFDDLGSSAQGFVLTVRSLDGWFDKLKETAAGSLFPGLTAGLKAALSPDTVAAITRAVTEFGTAIGNAGEQWGRYFGSDAFRASFGPLMAAGARNLSLLSDAALSLFDAMGVLGRAAIPFTQWMTEGIAKGAQLADSWLHAKEASGALGGALNEAKTSLQLVGNLFVSLGRAVYELGAALYPVSKIAVKDLTDGFNALAGIIDRNKQTIRDIVGGALAALVSTIRTLWPIVAKLAEALVHVVDAMGGWKGAFELVIGGLLASKFLGLAQSVALVGQASKAAALEAGGFRAALLGLGAPEVLAALAAVAAALLLINDYRTHKTLGHAQTGGDANLNTEVFQQGGKYYKRVTVGRNVVTKEISSAAAHQILGQQQTTGPGGAHSGAGNVGPNVVSGPGDFADETPAFKNALNALATRYGPINLNSGFRDETKQTGLWDASVKAGHPGFMPNGNPIARPKSRGGTGSDHSRGTAGDGSIFYKGKWTPLSSLPPEILQAYGLSTVPGDVGHVMLAGATDPTSPFGSQPAWTKNLGTTAKTAAPTGAALLPQSLRDALQRTKDKATTTQGATAARWLNAEMDVLGNAKANLEAQLGKGGSPKHVAAIKQEIRSIDGQIASVTKQITVNLASQAASIKTEFSSRISAAKSNISSAVSTLKATLDAQLQAHLQTYIDTVLGPKFFQGTDEHGTKLQTPEEAAYAAMQAEDKQKQLQDALAAAQTPEEKAAAQRAIDEDVAAAKATASRSQADYSYAQAVRAAQADYAEQQRQLNLQLDIWGKGLADGTTKLGDLGGIVEAFGLSLVDGGGVIDDFSALGSATQALAKVMADMAVALARVGDGKDSAAAQSVADMIGWQTTVAAGQSSVTAGLGGAGGYFMLNPLIPKLDVGGDILNDGLLYGHAGETIVPASVKTPYGSGSGVTLQVGPVYGAPDQATARRWAAVLKTEIDRLIQL